MKKKIVKVNSFTRAAQGRLNAEKNPKPRHEVPVETTSEKAVIAPVTQVIEKKIEAKEEIPYKPASTSKHHGKHHQGKHSKDEIVILDNTNITKVKRDSKLKIIKKAEKKPEKKKETKTKTNKKKSEKFQRYPNIDRKPKKKSKAKHLMEAHKVSRKDIGQTNKKYDKGPGKIEIDYSNLWLDRKYVEHINFVESIFELNSPKDPDEYIENVKSRFINYLKMKSIEKFEKIETNSYKVFISLLYLDLFNAVFGRELLYAKEDIPKSDIREFYNLIHVILCGTFNDSIFRKKIDPKESLFSIKLKYGTKIDVHNVDIAEIQAYYKESYKDNEIKQYRLDISEALLEVLVANQIRDENLAQKVLIRSTKINKSRPSSFNQKVDFVDSVRINGVNLNPRFVDYKRNEFHQKVLGYRETSERLLIEKNIPNALFHTTKEINLSEKLFKFGEKNLSNSNIPKAIKPTVTEVFSKNEDRIDDLEFFASFSGYAISKDITISSSVLHFKALTAGFLYKIKSGIMGDLMNSNNYEWDSQKDLVNKLRNKYSKSRTTQSTELISSILRNFINGITKEFVTPDNENSFYDWAKWDSSNFGALPVDGEILMDEQLGRSLEFDLDKLDAEPFPETSFVKDYGRVASTDIYAIPYVKIFTIVSKHYTGTDIIKDILKDRIALHIQKNILSIKYKH